VQHPALAMAAHQPPVFVLPRADLAPSSSSPNSRTSPGHSTANALSQATDSLSLAELALPVPPPIPSTSRLQRAPTPPPPPAAELPQDASKPAKTKRGRKRIAEPLDNIKGASALHPHALSRPLVPSLTLEPHLPRHAQTTLL